MKIFLASDRILKGKRFIRTSAFMPKRGFTLVELAIVLAVAGLLFVGLWRLLASGNQQVRDQSAATQQQQMIASVRGYLASPEGQSFLSAMNPSATASLPLPSTQADAAGTATCSTDANITGATPIAVPGFCTYLTAGTWSGTPNSYGQTYSIQILKDTAPAGTPPNTYSFVITTSGGDPIPDTSGGRISAFIGSDGGFVYSTNVCGANLACGAYGTWTLDITTYGFAVPGGGTVASRTYVSPTASNSFPWLARPHFPGDSTVSPTWNTMETDLFLGGNNLWLGSANNVGTGAGAINLQNGDIVGTGQSPTVVAANLSNINLNADASTAQPLINLNGASQQNVYLLNAVNGCSITSVSGSPIVVTSVPAGCTFSINTDNLQVSGLAYANSLYSQTFIYASSDRRLKSNIHPIDNSLTDVMKLKPVSFTFKSNGKEGLGVIAQDLEKVYPQLVTKGEGMKSVNYEGLIGPLIGAVQELKKENDDLRQQLDAQKQREDQLEQKLEMNK